MAKRKREVFDKTVYIYKTLTDGHNVHRGPEQNVADDYDDGDIIAEYKLVRVLRVQKTAILIPTKK